jgi:P-type E1-E2 ATPase
VSAAARDSHGDYRRDFACGAPAIIIKNPAVLERIEKCRTLIFDKTGTLTYGRPNLSEITQNTRWPLRW